MRAPAFAKEVFILFLVDAVYELWRYLLQSCWFGIGRFPRVTYILAVCRKGVENVAKQTLAIVYTQYPRAFVVSFVRVGVGERRTTHKDVFIFL